jgi:hypothetical protein
LFVLNVVALISNNTQPLNSEIGFNPMVIIKEQPDGAGKNRSQNQTDSNFSSVTSLCDPGKTIAFI